MDNGTALLHYFNTPVRNSVTILGPTVNLASRLEGMAKKDEIIISKTLINMTKYNYNFVRLKTKDRSNAKTYEGIKAFEKEKFVYGLKSKK